MVKGSRGAKHNPAYNEGGWTLLLKGCQGESIRCIHHCNTIGHKKPTTGLYAVREFGLRHQDEIGEWGDVTISSDGYMKSGLCWRNVL